LNYSSQCYFVFIKAKKVDSGTRRPKPLRRNCGIEMPLLVSIISQLLKIFFYKINENQAKAKTQYVMILI